MNIGISIASRHNMTDPRKGATHMIERAKVAAHAGLDSLFVGDHHVTPAPYYQNTPILARCLAEWTNAPAGALYLLPFRHPVQLAEDIGTLATIMPQRFIMQCALGYGDHEFAAFGINPKHRVSRFEECLEIMRRLWAGETVTHHGRWQINEASINPTPPEPVEVWIGAKALPAIERAARLGDGWLAAPQLTPEQAKTDLQTYRECCAKHDRKLGATAIRRDIYIGKDSTEAEAVGGAVIDAGYRGMARGTAIIGDVEAVAATFREYAKMGYSDIIVRNLVPEQMHALACIERLAKVKEVVG